MEQEPETEECEAGKRKGGVFLLLADVAVSFLAVIGFVVLCNWVVSWIGARILPWRDLDILVVVLLVTAVYVTIRLAARANPGGEARFSRILPTLSEPILALTRIGRAACAMIGLLLLTAVVLQVITHWNATMRRNEATAVTALKSYATAQVTFSIWGKSKPGRGAGNTLATGDAAYADNYRNLFYGVVEHQDESIRFTLIPKPLADAFLIDNFLGGFPTADAMAPQESVPYSQYYFQEDPSGLLTASGYDKTFALMAFPRILGKTGRYVYWIGIEGIVYQQRPDAPKGTPAAKLFELYHNNPESTPLAKKTRTGWEPSS